MTYFNSEPRAYCPPCFVSSLSYTLRNFLLDIFHGLGWLLSDTFLSYHDVLQDFNYHSESIK